MRTIVGLAATCVAALWIATQPAAAATFVVDSKTDATDANIGDGLCATAGGTCTLRAALQEANALPGADVIQVPAGRYNLTVGPGFAVEEDAADSGDLDVTDDVTIVGAGVGRTVVSGKKLDRVFHILAPATVEISGLTIQDGRGPWGAGIWNRGTLTLRRVHIVKNGPVFDPDEPGSCNGDGVGIENWGTLVMLDSSIERNRGCRRDYSYGGGLANYGAATLTNVTVAGNRSHVGGGILNTGVLALTNVTLAFNSAISPFVLATAGMGGGLMNGGTVQILNTTITRNRASNRDYSGGGGVDNRFTSSALVTFQNSIIAGNTYPDCAGASSIDSTPVPGRMTSLGHNLRGTSTCPILAGGADLTGVGPRLRPARGTFPALFALAPGSPAIDAGDDASCPATDARGVARPQDGNGDGIARCDLGAYEVAP